MGIERSGFVILTHWFPKLGTIAGAVHNVYGPYETRSKAVTAGKKMKAQHLAENPDAISSIFYIEVKQLVKETV